MPLENAQAVVTEGHAKDVRGEILVIGFAQLAQLLRTLPESAQRDL
jgi:hypothetical protein